MNRCAERNAFGRRCGRPVHTRAEPCDYYWDQPESRTQTWTPPSVRGRGVR